MADEKKLIANSENRSELFGQTVEGQSPEVDQLISSEAGLSQPGLQPGEVEELTSTASEFQTGLNDDIDTQPVQPIAVEGESLQTTKSLEAGVLESMINPTDLSQASSGLENIFKYSSDAEVTPGIGLE